MSWRKKPEEKSYSPKRLEILTILFLCNPENMKTSVNPCMADTLLINGPKIQNSREFKPRGTI